MTKHTISNGLIRLDSAIVPHGRSVVPNPLSLEIIDGFNDLLRLVGMISQRLVDSDIGPRTFLAKASLGLDVPRIRRHTHVIPCLRG